MRLISTLCSVDEKYKWYTIPSCCSSYCLDYTECMIKLITTLYIVLVKLLSLLYKVAHQTTPSNEKTNQLTIPSWWYNWFKHYTNFIIKCTETIKKVASWYITQILHPNCTSYQLICTLYKVTFGTNWNFKKFDNSTNYYTNFLMKLIRTVYKVADKTDWWTRYKVAQKSNSYTVQRR